jgi:hypothetical protein
MEPTFPTMDEIVAVHRDQIAGYGGSEGVRDWGSMPSATFGGQFLHGAAFVLGCGGSGTVPVWGK